MPYAVWARRRLPRLLADDLIDVFWGQNQIPVRGSTHRFRLVMTVHDVTPFVCPSTMSFRGRLALRAGLGNALREADCLLVDSLATSRLLRFLQGVDGDKIHVVYPGCESVFAAVPREIAQQAVCAKFGLPPGYLLSVGTIEPRKDYLLLLSALELLPEPKTLVIVGRTGWGAQHALRRMRTLDAKGRLFFLDRVDDTDLAALYSAADLMVYPSRYEGFGLPVVEAMSCGCPVLCRWSSSMPEVGGTAAAYFIEPEPAAVSSAISQLLSDPRELRRMSRSGRLRSAKFSFDAAAKSVASLLHQSSDGQEAVTKRA
jgi:glycosyltransferase involved in cell wall biosynthesis